MEPFRSLLSILVAGVLVLGCSGEHRAGILQPDPCDIPTPAGCRVAVVPVRATMRVGDVLTFTATGAISADSVFTWTTTDSTALKVDNFGRARAVGVTPAAGVCATTDGYGGCATVEVTP